MIATLLPMNYDMYLIKLAKMNISYLFLVITFYVIAGDSYAKESNKICALYPHLKDSYWLSVNYGMVSEAEKQGVTLRVLEAGGYLNPEKQREQMKDCVEWGADAIILGTVSPTLFYDSLAADSNSIPIFATVNRLLVDEDNKNVLKGSVGVDWYWMGYHAGNYLKLKHPKGSGKIEVALIPGPKNSGGTQPVINGFKDAIEGSDVSISATYWADNDKELQRNLIQKIIDDEKELDYITGSAVAIEAAISELRAAHKETEVKLVSTYLSHGVYRGLLRNRIVFSPTDKMVEQGRISMLQAVNYLNSQPFDKTFSPDIETLTPNNINQRAVSQSLSPSEFRPKFCTKR